MYTHIYIYLSIYLSLSLYIYTYMYTIAKQGGATKSQRRASEDLTPRGKSENISNLKI